MSVPSSEKGLLEWAIRNSEDASNIRKDKLMSPEEFKELMHEMFPNESEILKNNLAKIKSGAEGEDLYYALDKVLFIVEGIDQADWFADLEGFQIIIPHLSSNDPEVRRAAAWIMSYALQNNPKVQQKFDEGFSLEPFIARLEVEDNEEVSLKLIGAISSAVRGYLPLRQKFYQLDGVNRLKVPCSKSPRLIQRFVWTIVAILLDEEQIDKDELNKCNLVGFIREHINEFDDPDVANDALTRLGSSN